MSDGPDIGRWVELDDGDCGVIVAIDHTLGQLGFYCVLTVDVAGELRYVRLDSVTLLPEPPEPHNAS